MDPTTCLADSIKNLVNKPLWMPRQWIHPTGSWTPQRFCMAHPHIPLFFGQIPMNAPNGGIKSKFWQVGNEHTQKANISLQARDRQQTCTLVPHLGKKRGRLSALVLLHCRTERRHTSLRILPQDRATEQEAWIRCTIP